MFPMTNVSDCNPELDRLRATVAVFMEQVVLPAEPALNRAPDTWSRLLPSLQRQAKERGIWGLPYAKELGGQGLALNDYIEIAPIEGRSEWGPVVLGSDTLLDFKVIERFGTEAQKKKYLQSLVNGEERPCFAMTEPDAPGSDPSTITTRATQNQDHWVINGRKWFISNAAVATYSLVMCRTSDAPDLSESLSAFLVPTSALGFHVKRKLSVLGLDREHAELRFEDLRVSNHQLLGRLGGGMELIHSRLALGRMLRCLHWLGQAERAFELLCRRLNERRLGTGLLGERQLMQEHVFESYADLLGLRARLQDLGRRLDSASPLEISTAKVVASRVLNSVVDRAVQVYGAEGLSEDSPLSVMLRTARATRIYDGPDELHMGSIAKSILKRFATL